MFERPEVTKMRGMMETLREENKKLKIEILKLKEDLPAGAKRYEKFRKQFIPTSEESGLSEWQFNEWLNNQLFQQDEVIKKLQAESASRLAAIKELRGALSLMVNFSRTHIVPSNEDAYAPGLCLACENWIDGLGEPSHKHKSTCSVLVGRAALQKTARFEKEQP